MPTRVREAAERLGLAPHHLDALLQQEQGWSWDLFAYEDEVATLISLADLRALAIALGVTPAYLLRQDGSAPSPLSFVDLRHKLQAHLAASGLDVATFGDHVGWTLEPFLESPAAAWQWSASGLHDICEGLAIDWTGVLAWLPSGV